MYKKINSLEEKEVWVGFTEEAQQFAHNNSVYIVEEKDMHGCI